MDTLHTNEERIEKIRCLITQAESFTAAIKVTKEWNYLESMNEDAKIAAECLDALEQFMVDTHTLDCI